MKPASPVVRGFESREVVFAKNQPEYLQLPALKIGFENGIYVERWHMTWRERIRALITGDVFIQAMTFDQPMTPLVVDASPPQIQTCPDCGVIVDYDEDAPPPRSIVLCAPCFEKFVQSKEHCISYISDLELRDFGRIINADVHLQRDGRPVTFTRHHGDLPR